jgi:Ca2+-binding RTX toxin-like protein
MDFSGTTILNSSALEIRGGSGHDTITGSANSDMFARGGDGNDQLIGGNGAGTTTFLYTGDLAGNDFDNFVQGTGTSRVVFDASTTQMGVTVYDDATNRSVDEIDATGVAAVVLTGNQFNNILDFSGTTILNSAALEIRGGSGHDTITGADGADNLFGDAGNDRFAYTAVSQSAAGAGDTLSDFTSGSDILDLSGVAFGGSFIGTDVAFTGAANEALFLSGSNQVQVDINGDMAADMEINGIASITGTDFDFV